VSFLKIEFGRVGADTHLTPREVIRDFIELLDIVCQSPDADVEKILKSDAFSSAPDLPGAAGASDTGESSGEVSDGSNPYAEFTI
jgi:hypothetical protein